MKTHVGKNVKVKAAGGISSFDDAEEFIRLGAERLGTSRLVKLMKNSPDKKPDIKKQNSDEKWMVPKWGCDRQAYRRYACLSAKARDCRYSDIVPLAET